MADCEGYRAGFCGIAGEERGSQGIRQSTLAAVDAGAVSGRPAGLLAGLVGRLASFPVDSCHFTQGSRQ
jgi:hypothetical protein